MNKIYLRFLALANALDGSSTQLADIDETAKRLLEMIALRHEQGQSMTVASWMTCALLA
jgi:Mrp family chromosome partitioning ATPase